jgi:DNA polymerase III alpha subunit
MIKDSVGQMIFSEEDIVDIIMSGFDLTSCEGMIVDKTVDIETAVTMLENVPKLIAYDELAKESLEDFDHRNQNRWHMPDNYKEIDIAAHVLALCSTQDELQRVGEELLLFQERDLFNLLRYLKYLVDLMKENKVIWGVGRGSSVASYVLYLLGVHKIDSMYYDLDPAEFLR